MINYAQKIADHIKSLTAIDRTRLVPLPAMTPSNDEVTHRLEACTLCPEFEQTIESCKATRCFVAVLINSSMLVCPKDKWI